MGIAILLKSKLEEKTGRGDAMSDRPPATPPVPPTPASEALSATAVSQSRYSCGAHYKSSFLNRGVESNHFTPAHHTKPEIFINGSPDCRLSGKSALRKIRELPTVIKGLLELVLFWPAVTGILVTYVCSLFWFLVIPWMLRFCYWIWRDDRERRSFFGKEDC